MDAGGVNVGDFPLPAKDVDLPFTKEELTLWESDLIEDIKKSIAAEGRDIKQEEIIFRVKKEASFIDNDYRLLDQGI